MKNKFKILIITAVLCLPMMAFSQSNTQGTIQLGLGFNVAVGGATISTDPSQGFPSTDGIGARILFGVRGQYGVTNNISVGVYGRLESAVYAATINTTDQYGNPTSDVIAVDPSGVGFGVEAKYYLINKDRFALYVGPSIGYSTSSADVSDDNDSFDETVSMSGLNWSIGAGFNFWFKDYLGMSLDLGYNSTNLSGTLPDEPDTKLKINSGNVYFGVGLITKFGGSGGGGGGGRHRR